MAENFDPYHKWLGIAPTEQPPNHYRLLGLNLFESDLDVIENGADRQMAHLRSFQSGPRMRECQQLLNEVAKARVVLLNEEHKTAYDNELQSHITPVKSPPVGPTGPPLTPADLFASPPPVATPAPQAPEPVPQATTPVRKVPSPTHASPKVRTRRRRRRKKSSRIGVVIAIVGCVLGLVVIAILLKMVLQNDPDPVVNENGSPDAPAKQPNRDVKPSTPVGDPSGLETKAKAPDTGAAVDPVVPEPDPVASGENVEPVKGTTEDKLSVIETGSPLVLPGNTDTSPGEPEPGRSLGDLLVPNVGAKLPIPDALARSNANDQIQQLFADDLNKDRTPDESAAFAEKLVEQANALGTKPVERYVLLETAIDVAAKGAAVEVAARALKELDRTFAVDLVQLQADAARQVARVAREPWQQTVVVELLESVIDKCLTDERYDLAILLVDAAISAARKAKVSSTTMCIAARSRNIRARHAAFQPVRAALQLMADGLDDPSHNETVGTYRCLVKGEWDEGLPFLAKIDESDLRAVAKQDIQLPTELEGQMAVADAWMKLVPDLDRHLRLQALLRAEFWYRQALAQQLGPQVKVIETRISNLGKKIGNIADLPMGAVLVMTFEPKTLQRRGYVLDVSNHGHVGVVSGALRADGKAGKSLAFDGRKSYVEVASTPWLSVPSEFAFVAWVNVAEWINPGKDANYVLCKEDGVEGSKGYILGFSDGGNLDFTFASADSWQRVVSVKQAGLATWHHLAAISDGKVVRLFLDGELTGEGPISEGIRPSGYPFRIGKSKYHESSGIHGRIDEVAVFNRALTPDEVRTIYRIGEAGRPLIE